MHHTLHRLTRVARLGLFTLLMIGCAPQEPAPVPRVPSDLSGPKAAALTFLRAIAAGDARTAQEASIGTPAEKQWPAAVAELVAGLHRYDRAIVARFGAQATSADVDLRQALQTMTLDPIAHIESGILSESTETAVIYPAALGIKLAAHPPMKLRKDKSGWKVDLSAMSDLPGHEMPAVRQYRAAAKTLNDVARQIQSGRYRSLADAQQAIAGNPELGSASPTP